MLTYLIGKTIDEAQELLNSMGEQYSDKLRIIETDGVHHDNVSFKDDHTIHVRVRSGKIVAYRPT
jgi:formylmethanofuran dehydrogenase subunit D